VVANDQVWAAKQVSNTIRVVSVPQGIVTDTIFAKAEPMDIVFAAGLAFVRCEYGCVRVRYLQWLFASGTEPSNRAESTDDLRVAKSNSLY
jgi:hypothetical protein